MITHDKTIKNERNKLFIILKRNSITVHSNTANLALLKSQNRLAVWVIFEIK